QGGRYAWRTFDYATTPAFSPTAITQLPDGSFATIERAFDFVHGVRCRVMRFEASQLQAGATVRAEELARLAVPYAVDNLEGLAATKGARGETLLWLIADDNFNPLQRNILLLFELAAP
ncbi:MAG TPA: esterase-like activity of phytase family protein, partial [Reyranella sp.]|nr:esterase-like activity of phytase family protein [Reyranella sp.]